MNQRAENYTRKRADALQELSCKDVEIWWFFFGRPKRKFLRINYKRAEEGGFHCKMLQVLWLLYIIYLYLYYLAQENSTRLAKEFELRIKLKLSEFGFFFPMKMSFQTIRCFLPVDDWCETGKERFMPISNNWSDFNLRNIFTNLFPNEAFN